MTAVELVGSICWSSTMCVSNSGIGRLSSFWTRVGQADSLPPESHHRHLTLVPPTAGMVGQPCGRGPRRVLRQGAGCLVETCRPARGFEHGDRVEVVTPPCNFSLPDRDDRDEPVVVWIPGLH
jgi:hypothetical protein